MKKIAYIIFLTLMILPKNSFASSSLYITEIMYDTEGSDTGREWVEIYNASANTVDLTKYKFFESGTAHSLTPLSGDGNLAANSYAIIAENANTFSSLYTSVPKSSIFDSSFSLTNSSGEYLAIKDTDGNILNEVTYDVSLGANGDGNSLQLNSSSWVASSPTVLSGYSASSNNKDSVNEVNTNTDTQKTTDQPLNKEAPGSSFTPYAKEPTMLFVFNSPKTVVVGLQNEYKAILYGYGGEIIQNGIFDWNFGDGFTQNIIYNTPINHIYNHPGSYTITITYKYNSYLKPVAIGKFNVNVIASPLKLTKFYTQPYLGIGIRNDQNLEYSIGGYSLRTENQKINIPENTYIGGEDEIVLTLPFSSKPENLELVDPYGYTVDVLSSKDKIIQKISTSALVANSYNSVTREPEISNNFVPKIINIQKPEKNNKKEYWLLVGVIILASSLVFIIRKDKNITPENEEEYTLQDE